MPLCPNPFALALHYGKISPQHTLACRSSNPSSNSTQSKLVLIHSLSNWASINVTEWLYKQDHYCAQVCSLLFCWIRIMNEKFIYLKSTTFINDKFYEMWANLPMNGLKRCIYVCFGPKKWRIGPLFTFFWIFALFKKICLRCFSIVYYSNYSALIF